MQVEIKKLTGPALCWAVAKLTGVEVEVYGGKLTKVHDRHGVWLLPSVRERYAPTKNWKQLGELIQNRQIVMGNYTSDDPENPPEGGLRYWGGAHCFLSGTSFETYAGIETAACRAVVAYELIMQHLKADQYGEDSTYIEVPDDILELKDE